MRNFESSYESIEELPVEFFESSTLIGSDTLKEEYMDVVKKEISEWKKLDPVILYNYKNVNFIIEGNQRAWTYWILNKLVPCVVVKNEEDFQRLKKMNIKLWELINFSRLEDVHIALAEHMYNIRRDKYLEYFV